MKPKPIKAYNRHRKNPEKVEQASTTATQVQRDSLPSVLGEYRAE